MTEFEKYKLVHKFITKEDLKSWVVESNYLNIFKEDWNALMPVVEKIEAFCLEHDDKTGGDLITEFYQIRDCVPEIHRVYNSVVEFIKEHVNE